MTELTYTLGAGVLRNQLWQISMQVAGCPASINMLHKGPSEPLSQPSHDITPSTPLLLSTPLGPGLWAYLSFLFTKI